MMVHIFDSDGNVQISEAPVDLRETFGDDDSDYEEALNALLTTGRWWGGGGAAPLYLLTRVKHS